MAYEAVISIVGYVDHWQTLVAGLLALVAAYLTVRGTNKAAGREIAQAQRQIEISLKIERRRTAASGLAFLAGLEAAMEAALTDVEAARGMLAKAKPLAANYFTPVAYEIRQRIKKTGFPELRTACLQFGGQLTKPFLRLDGEIDMFAAAFSDSISTVTGAHFPEGQNDGIESSLNQIEAQAKSLTEEARAGMRSCLKVIVETENIV